MKTTEVKTMKRLELLTENKEEKEKRSLARQIEKEKAELNLDIVATQNELDQLKDDLLEAKAAPKINRSHILKIQDEIDGLDKGLKALKDLQEELYS